MKILTALLLFALPFSVTVSVAVSGAVQDREAEQARLDAQCESAKRQLIDEGRSQRIDACQQEGKSKSACEQSVASFGQREGNKRPDFSTVPACQQAEQYRKSYRQ